MAITDSTVLTQILPPERQGAAMQAYHELTPRAHAELASRASLLTQGQSHCAEAVRLVEEGRVERSSADTDVWQVTGRSKNEMYPVRGDRCPCRTKRNPMDPKGYDCAHLVAVKLYRWVEETMTREGQPMHASDVVNTVTGEMATDTPETHEDGQEDTNVSTFVSLDPKIILSDSDANKTLPHSNEILPAAFPVLPSDLTPVDLPGGGQRTRSIGQLMQALARAQQRMKNPGRDARNPHLNNRYASMAETRDCTIPVLAGEGIGVSQWVSLAADELICWTMLGHCSGEYQLTPLSVPCPKDAQRGLSSIQARGSAISYAKRYGLQTVVMVVGDVDDDGEGAGRQSHSQEPRSVPDMTRGPARKSAAELRQEIEALARQQDRQPEYIWAAAEKRFERPRGELSLDQLEQMVKGMREKGTAA